MVAEEKGDGKQTIGKAPERNVELVLNYSTSGIKDKNKIFDW